MSIYDQVAPMGDFLKIKDCDNGKATVRFFGEPIFFQKEWDRNGTKEVNDRFATLCLYRNKKTQTSEVKVFEFGWMIQKKLRALAQDDEWGDPTGYDVTISVEGQEKTTKYEVVPRPKKELSPMDTELIKSCDVNLRKVCKADEPTAESDSYSPFDDED